MEERGAGPNARGGDEAIERVADRHALPARCAIEAGREREVIEALEPQYRKGAKVLLDLLRLGVRAQAPRHSCRRRSSPAAPARREIALPVDAPAQLEKTQPAVACNEFTKRQVHRLALVRDRRQPEPPAPLSRTRDA